MSTKKLPFVFAGLVLTLLVGCSKENDTIDSYLGFDIPVDVVDAHLENEMERLNIPGMSIAFLNDGEIVHHSTLGYANREKGKKVSEQTIFEAASLSKPLFAYFTMKYVEEGKLDLDTPLYTYLPYADIAYDERYKKITARMVLSHRTGFPNWRSDSPENKLFLKFDPGTQYSYSGEGYQYLAKVLRHLQKTDWEGLEKEFQQKVAAPLGMQHTVFIQDDHTKRNKAEAYDKHGEWISPKRDYDSLYRYQFRAPASVHSEALDFSKWLIALMDQKGLQEKSFEALYQVHSYVNEFDGVKVDYTLGFFKPRIPLANVYLHGGNNYGFTSYFAFDPAKKWGFVLFTNSEYGEQLGTELTFYLLAGPDHTKLYLVLGLIVLLLGVSLFYGIRFMLRKVRKR